MVASHNNVFRPQKQSVGRSPHKSYTVTQMKNTIYESFVYWHNNWIYDIHDDESKERKNIHNGVYSDTKVQYFSFYVIRGCTGCVSKICKCSGVILFEEKRNLCLVCLNNEMLNKTIMPNKWSLSRWYLCSRIYLY